MIFYFRSDGENPRRPHMSLLRTEVLVLQVHCRANLEVLELHLHYFLNFTNKKMMSKNFRLDKSDIAGMCVQKVHYLFIGSGASMYTSTRLSDSNLEQVCTRTSMGKYAHIGCITI